MFSLFGTDGLSFPLILMPGDLIRLPLLFKRDDVIIGQCELSIQHHIKACFNNLEELTNYYFGEVERCKPT